MGRTCSVMILVFSLFIAYPTHLWADREIPAKESKAPMIEPNVCHAGTVTEGDPLQCIYRVANRGKTPLVINEVVPSCRCISADFNHTIPAGGSGTIHLRVKTKGYHGEKVFSAKVVTNATDLEPMEIGIAGTIIPAITLSSDRVFFNGFVADRHIADIQICYNKGQADLLAVEQVGLDGCIAHRVVADTGENTLRLTIENVKQSKGNYRGRLVLKTGLAERPVIVIPVMARLMEDIQIIPESSVIDIGMSKGRRKGFDNVSRYLSGHRFVFVRCNRGSPFTVSSVEYDHSLIAVDVAPINERTAYRIRISPSLRVANRDKLPLETGIVIHTDYPKYEKIDVPVTLK